MLSPAEENKAPSTLLASASASRTVSRDDSLLALSTLGGALNRATSELSSSGLLAAPHKASPSAALALAQAAPGAKPATEPSKLRWKWWTCGLLRVFSFLAAEEVKRARACSHTWRRVANHYLEEYTFEPPLPDKELEWIKAQVEQSSSFFERAFVSAVCKAVVVRAPEALAPPPEEGAAGRHRAAEAAAARLGLDALDLSRLPEVANLRERIDSHKGHCAIYPALALQLLGSAPTPAVEAQYESHAQTFRLRHWQRKLAARCERLLRLALRFTLDLVFEAGAVLSRARSELAAAAAEFARQAAERFVASPRAGDGRLYSLHGILPSDLLDEMPAFHDAVEFQMAQARRGANKEAGAVVAGVRARYLARTALLADRGYRFPVEELEEDTAVARLLRLLDGSADAFVRSLTLEVLEPAVHELVTVERLTAQVVARVRAHLASPAVNPAKVVAVPYFELLGVAVGDDAPVVGDGEYTASATFPALPELPDSDQSLEANEARRKALLARNFPLLECHEALNAVDRDVDAFLDHFIDQRYRLEPDDATAAAMAAAPAPAPGAACAAASAHSKAGALPALQPLPRTVAELAARPQGWLARHVFDVYRAAVAAVNQRARLKKGDRSGESRSFFPLLRAKDKGSGNHASVGLFALPSDADSAITDAVVEYAARRYVHHALMRENAARVLNYGPRGSVVAPLRQRHDHTRLLASSVRSSLLRDFGSLARHGGLLAAIEEDNGYTAAIAAMSLRSLVLLMDRKRKQIAELEKRRKMDEDGVSPDTPIA